MESLKQAFQRTVPDADERELLRREYGLEAISNLYQEALKLEHDPASAFAESLNAQLLVIRSKGKYLTCIHLQATFSVHFAMHIGLLTASHVDWKIQVYALMVPFLLLVQY